jgi:hypothetical protein
MPSSSYFQVACFSVARLLGSVGRLFSKIDVPELQGATELQLRKLLALRAGNGEPASKEQIETAVAKNLRRDREVHAYCAKRIWKNQTSLLRRGAWIMFAPIVGMYLRS